MDLILEETINAVATSKLTGIAPFIQSKHAMRGCMVTTSARTEIVNSYMNMTGMTTK